MTETKQNFKLHPNDLFISSTLLNNIIKKTTAKKVIIEEATSELWYETYNGEGTIQFKNSMQYKGNLHFGLIDNPDQDFPCTLIFPSGTKYIGTIKNNEITGTGQYFFRNGSSYSGEVLNGLRHGKGIFKTADGIVYDGDWKLGLKHGNGRLIQGEMELEGAWVEGKISGKCRIKWKSGNIYDGQISDNKMNGNGYMIWFDKNEKYVGKWEENLENGLGVYIWNDNKISINKFFKDRYVGEWKEGKRDGYGIFFYSNGSIYEGYWKDDKKEGFGILSFQERTKISGLFHNDIFFCDLKDSHLYLKNDDLKESEKKSPKKLTVLKGKKDKRKSTFFLNKLATRFLEKKITKMGIGLTKAITKDIKKEEIKDKKDKEAENQKNLQSIKENAEKSIKASMDEIKIKISIEDISIIEPFEKETYKKLDDLLLRNLSLISKLYIYATWGEEIKLSDIGFSTGSPSLNESKSKSRIIFKQQLQIKKENNVKDLKGLLDENYKVPKEEKKENNIIDNVYTNDVYFCLNLKNFWRFLRESGLNTPDFSLAMIDRFIFQNPENQIDIFLIPEELERLNGNVQKIDEIYNYIYQRIIDSKNIFEIKNKTKIDLSNKILNKLNRIRQSESDYLKDKEDEISNYEKFFDYHDEKNIILLRYFYDIIIRLAFFRFDDSKNLDIEGRLNYLLDFIKIFMKTRKKTKVESSVNSSQIDPKLKNMDDALESYISNYYEVLKNIFIDLYKYNCSNEKAYKSYDMTITYRFFFDKIILNSEKLSELFQNKQLYVELISWNFKDNIITNKNISNMEDDEMFEYLDTLYDYEMIFREFCELIFYISRKYFVFYDIDTKWEDFKMGLIINNDEKKTEDEDKKVKKKKKTKRIKNIDIYMIVLEEIIKAKNIAKEKIVKNKKNKYNYPILNTHLIIEKNEEEERRRITAERNREMDRKRFENERKNFKEEDINIYKGEDEHKSISEEESSEYD